MPVCVLPGSSVCPTTLPQREAFGEALPQLLPQSRGLEFDMRLLSPESLGRADRASAQPKLRDHGALRFLVLRSEGDVEPHAPEPLEPMDALRTMEICGQLSFVVNQAFGQHGVSCKVRVYPPVPQSQGLGFGALRHAAAAVFERVKQLAREAGGPVTDVGVRLRYDSTKAELSVQLLPPRPQPAALIALPVFETDGGLDAAVEAVASALAAAGVQKVECDQASREPFARYVQERGKALKVLPSSIRKLMANRKPPH
jgi:hypothetical protein